MQGSHGSPAMTFSWQSPNFYWLFAARKYDILTFPWIHTFVISCAVPSKSLHNLQNLKYYGNTFPDFLAFLWGRASTSWHWRSGLHIDINSIFPDFSWLFGEFQNFLTHMIFCWLLPDFLKILTFSWLFPDLWELWYEQKPSIMMYPLLISVRPCSGSSLFTVWHHVIAILPSETIYMA